MTTMIEKCARALALADLDEESRQTVDIDAHMVHVRAHYVELAMAVIDALMEPSIHVTYEGAKAAAEEFDYDIEGWENIGNSEFMTFIAAAKASFRAMLSKAKSE